MRNNRARDLGRICLQVYFESFVCEKNNIYLDIGVSWYAVIGVYSELHLRFFHLKSNFRFKCYLDFKGPQLKIHQAIIWYFSMWLGYFEVLDAPYWFVVTNFTRPGQSYMMSGYFNLCETCLNQWLGKLKTSHIHEILKLSFSFEKPIKRDLREIWRITDVMLLLSDLTSLFITLLFVILIIWRNFFCTCTLLIHFAASFAKMKLAKLS